MRQISSPFLASPLVLLISIIAYSTPHNANKLSTDHIDSFLSLVWNNVQRLQRITREESPFDYPRSRDTKLNNIDPD